MVGRRVEIKQIEDKAKRQTTFTKRRKGLFKKAEELGKKCDIHIAVITFSKAGNLYATGNPSVNAVINRYMSNSSENRQTNEANPSSHANQKKYGNELEEILGKIEEVRSKILSMPAEDSELHGLDKTVAELEDMKAIMQEIKARTHEPNHG